MEKKYLFVCGSPRSGTTAMWNFLANDNRIKMGVERYGNLFFRKPLTTELFEYERFFDLQEGDTFYNELNSFSPYYKKIIDNYEGAEYYGDKIPLLYKYLDRLNEAIPNSKVIIMIRNIIDVSASYEARANNDNDESWSRNKRTASAIEDWRDSLKVVRQNLNNPNVIPIIYEDFYSDINEAKKLFTKIELSFTEKNEKAYMATHKRARELDVFRSRNLDASAVKALCEEAPYGLYREILTELRNKNE